MKKTIIALFVLTLLVVFTGCGRAKPEQPVSSKEETRPIQTTYESDGSEKIVSITDFMDMMMCDRGKWTCPAQYDDYALEFSTKYGRNLVNMSDRNMYANTSDNLLAEIGSVSFNEEQKLYCVKLLPYDKPLEYAELHVEVSSIGQGVVRAENIYDSFHSVEYCFVADSGELMSGQIVSSGTFPIPAETDNGNEIIGVESQVWVLRDPDLLEDYKPLLSLDSAGYFSFKENLYAGMGHYYGVYTENENTIECAVYSIDFSGFAGDDVYTIVFEKTSPTTLTLKTELCYSVNGAVFKLQ